MVMTMQNSTNLTMQSKKKLNNGVEIPVLGLGTWQANGGELKDAINIAIENGYRHIDTAAFYNNEEIIGKTLKKLSIPREEIFITSKLWNTDHGYDKALAAFQQSLKHLQCEYLDLFLIHWPVSRIRQESWKALEHLYKEGQVRAIGVSNYMIPHLEELLASCEIIPAVNQFEFHPYIDRMAVKQFCDEHQIIVEAYSPMTRATKLGDPILKEIGDKYHKTPAQVLIRWGLEHEVVSLPKSVNKNRIKENASVFDFVLTDSDMKTLNSINDRFRVTIFDPEGPDFQ
jgi:diketogulonate reductase-like aldo/keto reductase